MIPLLALASLVSASVMPGITYEAYSYTQPDAMPGVALTGGWATAADVGPDKIYWTPAGEIAPHEVVISSDLPPAHRNDPTVIRVGDHLAMYYTLIYNTDATAALMDYRNHVAEAVSYDGGSTWQERGILIDDAWSPSAMTDAAGNNWLFWHTNGDDPTVQVAWLDGDAAPVPMALPDIHAVNVSVAQRQDGSFILVGNGIGPLPFYDVVAYTSFDLVHWAPYNGDGILIDAGSAELLTPEVKALPDGNVSVTFTDVVSSSETVTMWWEIRL